jgi:hypothetical protein
MIFPPWNGMLLAWALGPIGVMIAMSWMLEIVVRRKIGVYFGFAMILIITAFIARVGFNEYKACYSGNPLPSCEWLWLVITFLIYLTGLALPSLILSTIVLMAWSRRRPHRLDVAQAEP